MSQPTDLTPADEFADMEVSIDVDGRVIVSFGDVGYQLERADAVRLMASIGAALVQPYPNVTPGDFLVARADPTTPS